jgi:hypothetical protein
MNLIHDSRIFTKEWILEKSKEHNFPNPRAVEMFLWDIEISAQLQNVDDRLILKGGAAAQLYLPVDRQRGSTDIDIKAAPSITEREISGIVGQVQKTLPTLLFRSYTPIAPNPKLPLVTYYVDIKSALELTERKSLPIKADILLEDPGLPTTLVKSRPTFALNVIQMRIPTLGTCIGDKLLTLARGSVGMTKEEDYPKQMYDLDLLSEATSQEVMVDIIDAVRKLTPVEASYRSLKTEAIEAIQDTCSLTTSIAEVDNPNANSEHKRHIQAFQSFLVSQNEVLPLFKWASRALRIRYLATLVGIALDDRLQPSEATEKLKTAYRLADSLEKVPGPKVKEIRLGLLKMITTKIAYFKDLKGKPLSRVFWETVTPYNLEEIASLLPS